MEAGELIRQTFRVGEVEGKPALFVETEIKPGTWEIRRYSLTEIPWIVKNSAVKPEA